MSNILAKPFSWANRIINAVFRGAPNLITTSDLNRQIEALKMEMRVLQRSVMISASDLDYSVSEGLLNKVDITVSLSYVYCLGVRFDVEYSSTYRIGNADIQELRLYAKKELITSDQDFSKTISGAKFEDGTVRPAADHYVYSEPTVIWVDGKATPNEDFEYAENDGKEYICTLLRVGNYKLSYDNYVPCTYYVQNLTVPIGDGIMDASDKYRRFKVFDLALQDKLTELTPTANDDWKDTAHKLWSRLYTLERRFFMETLNPTSVGDDRTFEGTYSKVSELGTVTVKYSFHIVGNICFVSGWTDFPRNNFADPLNKGIDLTIGTGNNEMPHAIKGTDGYCQFIVGRPKASDLFSVQLYGDRLTFYGIPQGGATVYWYGV